MMPPELERLFVDLLNDLRVVHGWSALSLADPLLPPNQQHPMAIIRLHSSQAAKRILEYMTDDTLEEVGTRAKKRDEVRSPDKPL